MPCSSLGNQNETQTFFSQTLRAPPAGISRQNPGISRRKSLISLVSRGIPNFLAPTPSCGRPLPTRKKSGLKSLGLGSFFVPDSFLTKRSSKVPRISHRNFHTIYTILHQTLCSCKCPISWRFSLCRRWSLRSVTKTGRSATTRYMLCGNDVLAGVRMHLSIDGRR